MTEMVLLTTTELAARRGITRQHAARLVRVGKLTPFATLASGAFVFTEDQAQPELEEPP